MAKYVVITSWQENVSTLLLIKSLNYLWQPPPMKIYISKFLNNLGLNLIFLSQNFVLQICLNVSACFENWVNVAIIQLFAIRQDRQGGAKRLINEILKKKISGKIINYGNFSHELKCTTPLTANSKVIKR